MAGPGGDFANFAGAVAKELLGEPNKHLSSKTELRFGNKGSISIDLEKGVYQDHSEGIGGGVLDMIVRYGGQPDKPAAVEWLKQKGFPVEDRRPNGSGAAPAGGRAARGTAAAPRDGRDEPKFEVVRSWEYVDENGDVVIRVCRMENGEVGSDGRPKKTYRQCRPHAGAWAWGVRAGIYFKGRDGDWYPTKDPSRGTTVELPDARLVPYRLPELIEAISNDLIVFVTEGEKAADRLWDLGVPATTNPMGAGKWPETFGEFFRDANVVILPDNDEPGRKHRDLVGASLLDFTRLVRTLDLPGLREKEDVAEWLDAGGTPEALYGLVKAAARPFGGEPFVSRFNAVTWRDLDLPGPEHEWLIKGVLTRAERSMVAGPSQSGKTFLVLDMAFAICRGVPWMGRRSLRGGVIYQAGEGGKGVKKRIRAYRQHHSLSLNDDMPFVLLPKSIDLYSKNDQTDDFIKECRHWAKTFSIPLELVIIDTFSAATPGANENASEDVGPVLARCERIAEELRCSVMLVHHMNAANNKPRGHTSIFANLDNVLTVNPVEGLSDADRRIIREAVVVKQKDGEGGAKFRFVLPAVAIGTDVDGDPITSCVVVEPRHHEHEEQDDGKGIHLTPQCQVFLRAIIKATSEHGAMPPPALQLPASVRKVVDWIYVRDEFTRMTSDGQDEKDPEKRAAAIRKAISRHGDTLVSKGIIARDNPWIWIVGKKVRGFRFPGDRPPPARPSEPPIASDGELDAFASQVLGVE